MSEDHSNNIVLSEELVRNKINSICGKRVMLDFDLAELCNVETRALIQQVKRNIERLGRFKISFNDFYWARCSDAFKHPLLCS